MPRYVHKETHIFEKIWRGLNSALFKLNLLVTFIGILPLILFIYFNVVNFDATKVIIGCISLLTMIYANKSIQGG